MQQEPGLQGRSWGEEGVAPPPPMALGMEGPTASSLRVDGRREGWAVSYPPRPFPGGLGWDCRVGVFLGFYRAGNGGLGVGSGEPGTIGPQGPPPLGSSCC